MSYVFQEDWAKPCLLAMDLSYPEKLAWAATEHVDRSAARLRPVLDLAGALSILAAFFALGFLATRRFS